MRRHATETGVGSLECGKVALTEWQAGAPASPRVLVLGPRAALRVRGGGLEIEHGPHAERVSLRIDVDAAAKPQALLFDSHGEFMTGEALRWCARYSVDLLWPNGPGRLITMIETEAEAHEGRLTTGKPGAARGAIMRDVDASVMHAQCLATASKSKSLAIAVEIVRAKILAQARAASLAIGCGAHSDVVRWADGLKAVRSPNDVLLIEGHAAADYWRVFRDVGLRERKGGNLPRTWMRFPPRSAGRPAFHEGVGEAPSKSSPQHASHPINAMLNYAYVVEAGRLARALTARGLILPLGFLHKPKQGRNSLVWDAIEPIRPAIDARVFAFAKEREFGRSDFPQAG